MLCNQEGKLWQRIGEEKKSKSPKKPKYRPNDWYLLLTKRFGVFVYCNQAGVYANARL